MRNVHVYDEEILPNCFMLCAEHIDDASKKHSFVIWECIDDEGNEHEINDLEALCKWLLSPELKLIGFNNMKFDYQIAHYIIENRFKLKGMSTRQAALEIYFFTQEILQVQFPPVPPYRVIIPQRDLMLIHHFDNKHKAVSLKALQMAMNWPNVMDMPFSHKDNIDSLEKLETMREYCFNDVGSTKFFYFKSLDLIMLRQALTDKYQIDLRNANEAKIGQEIILDKIAKKLRMDMRDIRKMRTERPTVRISDVMLPYIKENVKGPFLQAYETFQRMVVTNSENDEDDEKYSFSLLYDDMQYDFGIGGLHAVRPSGTYSATADKIILSADVTSYYPNLSLQNGYCPAHFGKAFLDAYQEIYLERKLYKKGTPENYALKIALNGTYGKSRDKYSPLYDPMFTMQITINGQLLLAMLAQMVTEAGATVIMANTDGIEMFCPVGIEGDVRKAIDKWSVLTKMPMEYKQYSKLFIRDVNNYIGLYTDGTTYNKGAYEWREYDEKGVKLLAWHKDHSMLAVPCAVERFLVHGTPIMQTFNELPYDMFYIGKRSKSGGKFQIRYVNGENIDVTQLSKTVRYMIGKKGGYLFKSEQDGVKMPVIVSGGKGKNKAKAKKSPWTKVDSPWKVIDCMKDPGKEVKELIDYRYYLTEAKKLLKPILNFQSNAFNDLEENEQPQELNVDL